MSVKPRRGDVLKIHVSADLVAVAQIILTLGHGVLLVAVFPAVESTRSDDELRRMIHLKPNLVVTTMSSSIRAGQWAVIENADVSHDIPIPVYVVPVGPQQIDHLQDAHGKIYRPASPEEARELRAPTSFSPVAVEKAIQAVNGLREWEQRFDNMIPDWVHSAQAILPSRNE